jgi:hypothetical protein
LFNWENVHQFLMQQQYWSPVQQLMALHDKNCTHISNLRKYQMYINSAHSIIKIIQIKVKQLQPQYPPFNSCWCPLYITHGLWCYMWNTHLETGTAHSQCDVIFRHMLPWINTQLFICTFDLWCNWLWGLTSMNWECYFIIVRS